MKYQITLKKIEERRPEDMEGISGGLLRNPDFNGVIIFDTYADADEAIDIMKHLYQIKDAQKRKAAKQNK